tara:strand:- start:185 stop:961 length:777 start_codon:yes stop_codon:yes gene_type:complete
MIYSWSEDPIFCFTSDVDWASEEVLEYSHKALSGENLNITYFNTHPSSFINSLAKSGEVRQLIHPNFLPNSSHGESFLEVMEYCRRLVPDADGFRTHRYFEVNDIMDEYAKRGFKFFSNHCLRCEENITPLHHRSGMVSIPIFFEDGGYLIMEPDLNTDILKNRLDSPGLKVINFHAAHMVFNTPKFEFTRKIKDSLSRKSWNNLDSKAIQSLSYSGFGIRNVLEVIIEHMFKRNHKIMTINQISEEFIAKKGTQGLI